MPLAFPRRALASVAAGIAAACVVLTSAPAGADQVRGQEWWLRALHVTQAWESSRGAGITVAVLDTGVDPHQADLAGAVRTGPDYTGSGEAPGDPYWGVHGTAVASLIAGHGHGRGGADGIIGIAPAAEILSVRVTLENNDPMLTDPAIAGALPDAIARGIRYAVKHHATVIDLPLDPVTTPGAAGAGGSPAERAAVAYALAHHVVLVAPAGDDGGGADAVNYPAAYHGVISVGAFDSQFIKTPYSSRQPYVTLTAAGDGMIAASTSSGYADVSSTSAASAVVAGIVALIRSQFPRMTPSQVRRALTESTVFHPPGGRLDGSGYGTVDAARALAAAARIEEAVPGTGPSAGSSAPATRAPTPPPIRPTSKSLSGMLREDAGIAIAVFAVLLVSIVGFGWLRRRRARAARLAEVRAAARVPVPIMRQAETSPAAPRAQAGHPAAAPGTPQAGSSGGKPGGFGSFAAVGSPERAGAAPPRLAPWELDPAEVDAAGFRSTAFSRSIGGQPQVPAPPVPGAGEGAFGPTGRGRAGAAGAGSFPGASAHAGLFVDALSPRAPAARPPSPGAPAASGPPAGGLPAGAASASGAPAGGLSAGGLAAGAPAGALPASPTAGAPTAGAPPAEAAAGSQPGGPGTTDLGANGTPARRFGAASGGSSGSGPDEAGGAAADAVEPGGPGLPGGPGFRSARVGGSGSGRADADRAGGGSGGARSGRSLPAQRIIPRTPRVSGTPPWEPARQPDGEVPWARPGSAGDGADQVTGAGALGALPRRTRRQPDMSVWDVIAEEAWPGGPRTGRKQATPGAKTAGLPQADPAGLAPGEDGVPGDQQETMVRPIYVWNPGATTDKLPAIRPESGGKPAGPNRP